MKHFSLLLCALVLTGPAFAQDAAVEADVAVEADAPSFNLKERQEKKNWEANMEDSVSLFNKRCGYELEVSLDDDLVKPFMEAGKGAGAFCDEIVNGMAYMCDDEMTKEAITEEVKSLHCAYGADKEVGFDLSAEGQMTAKIGTDSSNIGDQTKAYLMENL